MYTFDENIVSDLHKEAFGIRPTSNWYSWWKNADDAERQGEWEDLITTMNAATKEQDMREAAALDSFEDIISATINLGANDEETAIRWLLKAENFDKIDLQYGGELACFHFNLNFSEANRFDTVMKNMLEELT